MSLSLRAITAVASTTVSPYFAITAAFACSANAEISIVNVFPAISTENAFFATYILMMNREPGEFCHPEL